MLYNLARGLADEGSADAWICLDADLQDPPEAVPLLLDRLALGDVAAVFAGRRGRYESTARRLTGGLHRRIAAGAADWLAPGGVLLVETSSGQASLTTGTMEAAGLTAGVEVDQDIGGCVAVGTLTRTAGARA